MALSTFMAVFLSATSAFKINMQNDINLLAEGSNEELDFSCAVRGEGERITPLRVFNPNNDDESHSDNMQYLLNNLIGQNASMFPKVCVSFTSEEGALVNYSKILLEDLKFWTHLLMEEQDKEIDEVFTQEYKDRRTELNFQCYLTIKGFYIAVKAESNKVTAVDKKAFEFSIAKYRLLKNQDTIDQIESLIEYSKLTGSANLAALNSYLEWHKNETAELEQQFWDSQIVGNGFIPIINAAIGALLCGIMAYKLYIRKQMLD